MRRLTMNIKSEKVTNYFNDISLQMRYVVCYVMLLNFR